MHLGLNCRYFNQPKSSNVCSRSMITLIQINPKLWRVVECYTNFLYFEGHSVLILGKMFKSTGLPVRTTVYRRFDQRITLNKLYENTIWA